MVFAGNGDAGRGFMYLGLLAVSKRANYQKAGKQGGIE